MGRCPQTGQRALSATFGVPSFSLLIWISNWSGCLVKWKTFCFFRAQCGSASLYVHAAAPVPTRGAKA
jgi:hypothetical protein